VEEIQKMQVSAAKQQQEVAVRITRLEQELAIRVEREAHLTAALSQQSDYHEIKKEIQ